MDSKTVLIIINLLLENGYVDAAKLLAQNYKLEDKK